MTEAYSAPAGGLDDRLTTALERIRRLYTGLDEDGQWAVCLEQARTLLNLERQAGGAAFDFAAALHVLRPHSTSTLALYPDNFLSNLRQVGPEQFIAARRLEAAAGLPTASLSHDKDI